MVAALTLTILVNPGEAASPATTAMLSALAAAAGAEVRVIVQEEGREGDAASEGGGPNHRAATATIRWLDDDRLQAEIRLHIEGSEGWLRRHIVFQPSDALVERGRALGFTLASMLPRMSELRPPPEERQERQTPAVDAPPPSRPPTPLAVDALAVASRGVGGDADGLGAALSVRRGLSGRLAWHVGLSGRLCSRRLVASSCPEGGIRLAWRPE
jgi:hypothetical protein